MIRSPTKKSPKRNEKTGEYQSGQMGQTVNLLVYTFGGSNPSSPTKARTENDRAFLLRKFVEFTCKSRAMETGLHCRGAAEKPAKSQRDFAEVAQSVEHQPSKLRVAGSNLVFRSNYASVAQG